MKSNIFKSILLLALSTSVLTSCANDDYGVPSVECQDANLTATKTVADIKNAATTTATLYTEDDIIEAVVVSSDKGGNFYKKIYLTSLDSEIGFSISINQTALYSDYQPGRKVFIKLKDLYVQMSHNTLAIGALYNGNVGQIAALDYRNHISRSCTTIVEETLIQKVTLEQAISDNYLGKLIELQDVQFVDAAIGQNYYNPANVLGGETNHLITDSADETRKLIFRTGSYAKYSALPVSPNKGKIRGILTKFNNDYQFIARYTEDIILTEERMGGAVDPTDPSYPTDPTDPTDPTTPEQPGANAVALFPSFDFSDFPAFLASLNNFGLQTYATQGVGTGINGGNSLHIESAGPAGNHYVFTTLYSNALPTNATKISFFVKGTSASKSLSLNVYKQDGSFAAFNVGDLTTNKLLTVAENNQYAGVINTNNQWVLVTLDVSSLTLANTAGANSFALKVGSASAYDLHVTNFVIE